MLGVFLLKIKVLQEDFLSGTHCLAREKNPRCQVTPPSSNEPQICLFVFQCGTRQKVDFLPKFNSNFEKAGILIDRAMDRF